MLKLNHIHNDTGDTNENYDLKTQSGKFNMLVYKSKLAKTKFTDNFMTFTSRGITNKIYKNSKFYDRLEK